MSIAARRAGGGGRAFRLDGRMHVHVGGHAEEFHLHDRSKTTEQDMLPADRDKISCFRNTMCTKPLWWRTSESAVAVMDGAVESHEASEERWPNTMQLARPLRSEHVPLLAADAEACIGLVQGRESLQQWVET